MPTVQWSQIARYIEEAVNTTGLVERARVVDMAYDDGASEDVIDVLDALGSRVFVTPDDVREFLTAEKLIQG
ncbi:MAG: hypothetical protein WBF37_00600 [Dehalococcoidia bacterium]